MKLTPSRRLTAVAAFVLVPVLASGVTASAANQTVTFKGQASAAGQTAYFTLNQDLVSSAPATVAPGGALTVTIDPAPNQVPTQAGGYTIREIKDFVLKIPVPANATYVSASTAGGSGLGSTPPTIALEAGNVVLKLKGPIKGGANFELPVLTLNLKAGAAGSIQTKLGGTSYDNPGLTFTAVVVVLFPVDAPAKAYPDPSPVLTATTIA
jgi:dehydratase